jgi:hypothetical protein
MYEAAPERLRLPQYPQIGHVVTPMMEDETRSWLHRFLPTP